MRATRLPPSMPRTRVAEVSRSRRLPRAGGDSTSARRNGCREATQASAPCRGTSSTGAAVAVTGTARGGHGGGLFSTGFAADGGDAELVDSVSGATSGELALMQEAIGGNAGSSADGTTPLAGKGTSLLTHVASADSVWASARATGGAGAPRSNGIGAAGTGANGRAEIRPRTSPEARAYSRTPPAAPGGCVARSDRDWREATAGRLRRAPRRSPTEMVTRFWSASSPRRRGRTEGTAAAPPPAPPSPRSEGLEVPPAAHPRRPPLATARWL